MKKARTGLTIDPGNGPQLGGPSLNPFNWLSTSGMLPSTVPTMPQQNAQYQQQPDPRMSIDGQLNPTYKRQSGINWGHVYGSSLIQSLAQGISNTLPNSYQNGVLDYNKKIGPISYLPKTANYSLQDYYGQPSMEQGGFTEDDDYDFIFNDLPKAQKQEQLANLKQAVQASTPEQETDDEDIFNAMDFTRHKRDMSTPEDLVGPRYGGSRNNYGNIMQNGQYANYATPKQGRQALEHQLDLYKSGMTKTGVKPDFTLTQAMNTYASDAPDYAKFVAGKLGVTTDTKIKDIDTKKWADAISQFEGNTNIDKKQDGGIVYDEEELYNTLGGEVDDCPECIDKMKKGGWIQSVNKSIKRRGTEGVCSGSNFGSSSCPPGSRRYALAQTFRRMAKNRKKEEGGLVSYKEGGEYEMTQDQIQDLISKGYKIDIT